MSLTWLRSRLKKGIEGNKTRSNIAARCGSTELAEVRSHIFFKGLDISVVIE